MSYRVSITRVEDSIDLAVKRAIELIGGITRFVKKGDTVLIKPNLTRVTSEPHVCTSPEVVRAVIRLCWGAGASRVIVGESSPVGVDTEKAFEVTGLKRVAEEEGAEVLDFKKCPQVVVEIPGGKVLRRIEVAKPVLEADVLINVPKLKTHCTCLITCAMKNLKGVLSDVSKREVHRLGLYEALVDLVLAIKPRLNVVDGVIAMEGLGPVDGDPVEMGIVMAGDDPLAVDVVATQVMGFRVEDVPPLRVAIERGLAPKLERIEILGEPIERVRRSFKRPEVDLERYLKYVEIYMPRACSGCVGTIMNVLKILERKGELELLRKYVIIAGPVEESEIPRVAGKQLILFGNCTARYRELGLFIPGCPPRIGLTVPTLERGCITDVEEERYLRRLKKNGE